MIFYPWPVKINLHSLQFFNFSLSNATTSVPTKVGKARHTIFCVRPQMTLNFIFFFARTKKGLVGRNNGELLRNTKYLRIIS